MRARFLYHLSTIDNLQTSFTPSSILLWKATISLQEGSNSSLQSLISSTIGLRESSVIWRSLRRGLLLFPRRIDSEVQARELTLRKFNAWLDDPSAGLHNLEIYEASKEWFIDLMTAGMWLSVSHVDVFLHFARKNSHLQSQHLSPSCAIMDTLFWSCMNGRGNAFQHNPDSYNWDSDMLDYPVGKSPKHSRPWSEVESLYLSVNIRNRHWIAVCVDLMRRKLTIYDSTRSQSAPEDEFSFDILKPMATMLPSLLVQSGFYAQRPELNPLSTPFKVVHVEGDIPRQSVSGDCGVFMLKFLEYLSLGKPLNFRQADMALFRKRMALEMFAMNP